MKVKAFDPCSIPESRTDFDGYRGYQEDVKQMLDKTEEKILQRIDAYREQIINFAEDIASHPEPGLKRYGQHKKTAGVSDSWDMR